VLGAYLILFPRSRIASIVPIFIIFTLIEVPAFIYLIFWFFSQLYSGLFAVQGGGGSGIAWWAHIGGFIFGVLMVSFFARKNRAVYSSY
jgi:membrane associated rhomboid family serine protease